MVLFTYSSKTDSVVILYMAQWSFLHIAKKNGSVVILHIAHEWLTMGRVAYEVAMEE